MTTPDLLFSFALSFAALLGFFAGFVCGILYFRRFM